MESWISLAEKLKVLVNPATFPVAVKLMKDPSQIPKKARRPLRDLKVRMAPCQGAAMARRYGWTVAFAREDVGCAIAAHTYGWERMEDLHGPVHFLTRMDYVADEAAAVEDMRGKPCLEMGDDVGVLYSPLDRAASEPDVVLIYVNPAQLMRLIHGATQRTGRAITSRFSGRAASCTEGVIGAFLDKEPKVVVPGNGDRVWAGCQDHEMVMAIPYEKLPVLVDGLERTHRQGVRYPIPTYLRYSPEVGLALPLSDIFRPEEVDRVLGPQKR